MGAQRGLIHISGLMQLDEPAPLRLVACLQSVFASVIELRPHTERLAAQLTSIQQLSSRVCGTSDDPSSAELITESLSSCAAVKYSVNLMLELEQMVGQMQAMQASQSTHTATNKHQG